MARIPRMAPSLPSWPARLAFAVALAAALLHCGGGRSSAASRAPMPVAWTHAMALRVQDPVVAMDPHGRALAAWTETGAHSEVKAQWMMSDANALSLSDPNVEAWTPQVAVDADGSALLVWAQYDGGVRAHLWGRHWDGAGWGSAAQISANVVADASAPALACDAAGHAILLWHEGSGAANHFDVHGSFYLPGAGWGAPGRLSDGLHSAFNAHAAMNAAGQAMAVWTQAEDDGSTSNGPQDAWAAAFSPAGGWGPPAQLGFISGATAWVYGQTAIALDDAGRAAALWIQVDAPGTGPLQVWARAYTQTSGWGPAGVISDLAAGGDAYAPDVAVDGSGHAMAVWQQQNGTSAAIAASRLTFGGAWTPPQTLSAGGDAYDPHVAFGATGEAMALWYQDESPNCPVRAATASGNAWAAPVLVDSLSIPFGLQYPVPRLASNPAGAPYPVWGVDSM